MRSFTARRKVEFADTDMGGIVHFSKYFVFMETAEHEFLEALGSNVVLWRDGRQISWPRVSVSCEYARPMRFGDRVEIHVQVRRKGVKSMTYDFRFVRGEEEIARGSMTSVCCEVGDDGIRAIPIPEEIAGRIEED
jgi:YbgC/YbaW family acyl-CoA thioester hydrolase